MTLHWWMHWFWVTALLIVYVSSGSFAAPQSEELHHITTDVNINPPERASRALYFPKPSPTKPTQLNNTNTSNEATTEVIKETSQQAQEISQADDQPQDVVSLNTTNQNLTEIVHPQWTPANVTEETNSEEVAVKPVVEVPKADNHTNSNITVIPVNANATGSQNVTSKKRNSVKPEFVKEASLQDAVSESKTDKPLSLETTLLQTRIPNLELYRRVADSEGGGSMDTGAIAGISFAALVLAALAGSTAFVLYRRRYLNKPQTLNDKCSNPDSSGYLDDSTIRDNSEEMYSLDNDSFLNSLEAMTIQNYWTDTVKHTKL